MGVVIGGPGARATSSYYPFSLDRLTLTDDKMARIKIKCKNNTEEDKLRHIEIPDQVGFKMLLLLNTYI